MQRPETRIVPQEGIPFAPIVALSCAFFRRDLLTRALPVGMRQAIGHLREFQ
jgi:hypothetical protein